MNKKKIERSLKKIAAKNGVSVAEVRRDIEAALNHAKSNPDPQIQAFWASIPCKGDKPTPEEVIAYAASLVDKKKS